MSDQDFVYHDPDDEPDQVDETELEVEDEGAGEEIELAVVEEEVDHGDEMATIIPRKWRGFASELEVNQEKFVPTRPQINMTVHRVRKHFGSDCNFQNSDPENIHMFASFESQDPSLRPFIHRMEIDRGIQVRGPSVDCSTQTGMSFKRNKMIQSSIQAISDENIEILMDSKSMARFFVAAMPRLEKAMQQNEMVDLLFNDYKNLKSKHGHELEFQRESVSHPDDLPPDDKPETTTRNMDWMRLNRKTNESLVKREDVADAEEIEQEERLNQEYLEFLKFQTEVVEVLKMDEPELPTEDNDMSDEFEILIREAQQQQAQEEAEAAALLAAEEEEEEEEQGSDPIVTESAVTGSMEKK